MRTFRSRTLGRVSFSSGVSLTGDVRFHFRLVSPFGELLLRRDVDLVLHAADLDDVTQVPRLSVDLYPLFEEGFLSDRTQ